MSALGLLQAVIEDGKAVMDGQALRIQKLEDQLRRGCCNCGCKRFRMVSIHSTRCPYRIALEIVDLEVTRGG
jgi:hypothetical protein